MKYKIISAVSIVLLLVLPFALQALRSDSAISRARGRYIQHLEAPKEQSVSGATDPAHFQTHLPVVEIDTDDMPIPGSWILNAHGPERKRSTGRNRSKPISAGSITIRLSKHTRMTGSTPAL